MSVTIFKSKKAKINYKFLAKYLFQYFQIFSIFIYNNNFPIQILKTFEKTLIQHPMRKEKLRKVGLCFITGYFIKPFKMTINLFFFNSSFCSQDIFYFASSFAHTGRQLNVHKTFRKRPGRHSNFLCTFNLRPVSTGLERQTVKNGKLKYLFQNLFGSFINEHNTNKFYLLTNCAYMALY